MKLRNTMYVTTMFLIVGLFSTLAYGQSYTHNTPGVSGYDPVSYFEDGKPMMGTGWNVAEFEGVTYSFSSKKNKKLFMTNPKKYVPAYGGYCAYGVAVKKKFVADPQVWKIVNGSLYLNLDKSIQDKWAEDIDGYIKKGNRNWVKIKDKAPSDL